MSKRTLIGYSLCLVLSGGIASAEPREKVLYKFGFGGKEPYAGLLLAGDGDLYGTTNFGGGTRKIGTVFRLKPPSDGSGHWTRKILHRFAGYPDGQGPQGGLVMGEGKVLYGTAGSGGQYNHGIVYSLTPLPGREEQWTYEILYSFNATTGDYPQSELLLGPNGSLYGTTIADGAGGGGTVFQLSPPAAGTETWTLTTLHAFSGGADGGTIQAGVISYEDALYGTAMTGGAFNAGTVYKLTPPVAGTTGWSETILHDFTGAADGGSPYSRLAVDPAGTLYGTAPQGGAKQQGTVFALTPPGAGQSGWTFSLLKSFGCTDGAQPYGGVTLGRDGALFGVTAAGCGRNSGGTVYKLAPAKEGKTTRFETVLHGFSAEPTTDGRDPLGSLVIDSKGHLFGTTRIGGGHHNDGSVFRIDR